MLKIDYTNWRGERRQRTIQPLEIRYGSTQWHPEPSWLLKGSEAGKGERFYALENVHDWEMATATLSHGRGRTLEETRTTITERGDLPHITVDQQLEILEQLNQFPFGRHLISEGGVNGYWTDYMINPPEQERSELEEFLLFGSPLLLATRRRYGIFRQVIASETAPGKRLASIPCGLMGDLLARPSTECDYIGVDLDFDSLKHACKRAEDAGVQQRTQLLLADAWELPFEGDLDLISSNGLNIYEPDEARVEQLYASFYKALKPGGKLVTSCITPPPSWQIEDPTLLLQQRIVAQDVVGANFFNFRTVEQTKAQLERAGFKKIEVLDEPALVFPTFVATS
jgi:SAM-dependent methyltransferase